MTQTSLKLIVSLPENDVTGFRRASLSRACGGNDTIGEVLNFFVYKASGVAQHLNLEEGEFVRIEHCTLDDITERVKVSKRTLHSYIKQLETWEYVKAYPYHQTYDIYFQKITDALTNPPAPPPPKLRGRHVFRALSPEEQMLKLQSRYAELEEEMSKLTSQMSKLTSQKLDLTSQMSNLTFEKSKLTSSKSCEDASEQGVIGDFDEDRILEEEESKEGEEENDETHTPFSCTREIRGIGASLQEEHSQTPSWYKTDRKAVSKKPAATYTKVFVSPAPPMPPTPAMEEPRPLTKNEQRYLNEQERNAIWSVIEDVLHTSFPYRVRTQIFNTRGMDALIEDHYSPDDIKTALTGMEVFHRNNLKANFTLEKLHLKMPGLLAAREEPPKTPAHSSRPLDIAPPLGGRRLDSGPGMMPGLKGVRHA